jgi:hypothetical protein
MFLFEIAVEAFFDRIVETVEDVQVLGAAEPGGAGLYTVVFRVQSPVLRLQSFEQPEKDLSRSCMAHMCCAITY